MMAKFQTAADVDRAFEELKAFWDDLLSVYQLEHPEEGTQPGREYLEPVPVHGNL